MARPTVEDVSDSDPSDIDIDTFSPPPAATSTTTTLASRPKPSPPHHQQQPLVPRAIPQSSSAFAKRYQCLYPIYFDARRTRASGRRVPAALAVHDPLAVEIATACHALGLRTVLEMNKTHPGDWANPGRVRVDLSGADDDGVDDDVDGNPFAGVRRGNRDGSVKNKHHLMLLVAQHLQQNPTTAEGRSLRARIPGAPPGPGAGEEWPRPAVPRGWTMGQLLPFVSPALTGGGVSEDLLNDMMKQMQGGGNPMEALMGGMGGGMGMPGMPGMGGGGDAGGGGAKKKGKGKAKA